MSRLRQTLAVCLLAMAAASIGCAHCSTCADFPAPAPTGYTTHASTPVTMAPSMPISSAPMGGSMDASAPAPPEVESKPAADAAEGMSPPAAPGLPQVNP